MSVKFQDFVDYIGGLAKQYNLQYWDFNLMKKEYLQITRDDYYDNDHLNGYGAEKFSKCLAQMMNGELEDPFYDSFEEKLIYNPDGTRRESDVNNVSP